ncbi:DUF6289 family protein [Thalassotalea hakodatensis]|uniref:DUF6289 family protein n=1 Tax=Thalassotalea hakodatensis TaxID=3030492 RepID=UPI0025738205|nr:DUF6289 family protein [Thalassotalea hakodatensis]
MNIFKNIALVVTTCTLTLSTSAIGNGSEIETTFYQTAAKQNAVGGLLTGCGERPRGWGTRTEHYTVEISPCWY